MFEIETRLQKVTILLTEFWHPVKLVPAVTLYHTVGGKYSRNHSSHQFHGN